MTDITTNAAAESPGQRTAREFARDYLRVRAFSRSGLIRQLEFEGLSAAEAAYGVDELDADWGDQAEKSAGKYRGFLSLSGPTLVAQLVSEGFTQDQAHQVAVPDS